eukprot:16089-Heterococcus_DN1.PRE.2
MRHGKTTATDDCSLRCSKVLCTDHVCSTVSAVSNVPFKARLVATPVLVLAALIGVHTSNISYVCILTSHACEPQWFAIANRQRAASFTKTRPHILYCAAHNDFIKESIGKLKPPCYLFQAMRMRVQ